MPLSPPNTYFGANRRYGILFAIVAVLVSVPAVSRGDWFLLCLWPAIAFAGLSLAYFTGNPRVFGKRADGTVAPLQAVVLLPVLTLLSVVFHLSRLISREPAHHQIAENLVIGRRLLSHELPKQIGAVIDLTSEFREPRALRERDYHSFPILDASVPAESLLHDWLRQCDRIEGTIYIHCAQGHGRTALFTACLLLQRGLAASADEALSLIQSHRPHARLNAVQDRFLRDVALRLTNRG